MRVPDHKRNNPKHRAVMAPPAGTNLAALAQRIRYVGSPNHKDESTFAGRLPQPIPNRSVCPRDVNRRLADIQRWLRDAVERGHARWEENGEFPKYVWHREENTIFEGRHIVGGQYKGYPLEPQEEVRGLPQ